MTLTSAVLFMLCYHARVFINKSWSREMQRMSWDCFITIEIANKRSWQKSVKRQNADKIFELHLSIFCVWSTWSTYEHCRNSSLNQINLTVPYIFSETSLSPIKKYYLQKLKIYLFFLWDICICLPAIPYQQKS